MRRFQHKKVGLKTIEEDNFEKKVKKEFKIKVKLKFEDKDNVSPHDEITDTSNLEPNADILKIRIFFD